MSGKKTGVEILLDVLYNITRLEFSPNGEFVKCPVHGWSKYIVFVDGTIKCRHGHVLWMPMKLDIDKLLEEAYRKLRMLNQSWEPPGSQPKHSRPTKPRPPPRTQPEYQQEDEEIEEEIIEEENLIDEEPAGD